MTPTGLLPMSTGELLDRTFSLYRNHFLLFAGITAVPNVFLLAFGLVPLLAPAGPAMAIMTGVSMLVAILLYLVAYGVSAAATVFAVSEIHLGRRASIAQAFRRMRGKAWRVFAATILYGMAVMGGFILLLVPGVWALARGAVVIPAAVLENLKAPAALRRSVALTKGHTFRILLIIVLFIVLSWAALLVFQGPFEWLKVMLGNSLALTLLSQLGGVIAGILVGPLGTIALSLVYYDERVRKEAFDLQLMMAALDDKGPGVPLPLSQPAASA